MIETFGIIVIAAAVGTWIDRLMKAKKRAPFRYLNEPPERRHGQSNRPA